MNDITKLPKWAQEHIRTLECEREVAIRTLNEFQDAQTPARFYVEDNPCTGEGRSGPVTKRKWIQGHRVTAIIGSTHIEITLDFDDPNRLTVSASDDHGRLGREAAYFQPVSFQRMAVIAVKESK